MSEMISEMGTLPPDTPALQIMASMPSGKRSCSSAIAPARPSFVARLALMSPPLRSMFTTSWPRSRRISAVLAPMPLVAPVMT